MTSDSSGRRWVGRALLVEASLLAFSAALGIISPFLNHTWSSQPQRWRWL